MKANQEFLQKLREVSPTVKEAMGDKVKSFQSELENLSLGRRLRAVYSEGEDNSDRFSIIQRFLIFMTALKRANFQGYEFLRFSLDLFLNDVEIVGFPHPVQKNPLEKIYVELDTISRKLKGLLNKGENK